MLPDDIVISATGEIKDFCSLFYYMITLANVIIFKLLAISPKPKLIINYPLINFNVIKVNLNEINIYNFLPGLVRCGKMNSFYDDSLHWCLNALET